jgi:ribosomal protein S18 acetylase RimI-like enzyme
MTPVSLNSSPVTFRPIRPEDEAFLYQVYASTRADELALVNWGDAQKDAFLRMQFNAQHQDYQANYGDADFLIMLLDDRPIGRLYIVRWENEIHIIDIALLPEYRNAGIGSAVLKDIQAEAATVGKPVRIHVERFNPALRLYRRLGFSIVKDQGVYYLMEWSPCAPSTKSSK